MLWEEASIDLCNSSLLGDALRHYHEEAESMGELIYSYGAGEKGKTSSTIPSKSTGQKENNYLVGGNKAEDVYCLSRTCCT